MKEKLSYDDFEISNLINIIEYELSYRDYYKEENIYQKDKKYDCEYTKKDSKLVIEITHNYVYFSYYEKEYIIDQIDIPSNVPDMNDIIEVLKFVKKYGR